MSGLTGSGCEEFFRAGEAGLLAAGISSGPSLRQGWRLFIKHPVGFILGWGIVCGAITGMILVMEHLSRGLLVGFCIGLPALIVMQIYAVRLARGGRVDSEPRRPLRGLCRLGASWLIVAVVAFVFDRLILFTWVANPLSGAIMHGVTACGLDEYPYIAGMFDLWTWHAVLAVPLFLVFLGWIFVPHLIDEGIRPFAALRRSWRMVTGTRLGLFGIALKTFLFPSLLAWTALYLTVIPVWIPGLAGSHLFPYWAAVFLTAVLCGPWFTTSLAVAYVALKAEDDDDERRAERQRSARWFHREDDNHSEPRS